MKSEILRSEYHRGRARVDRLLCFMQLATALWFLDDHQWVAAAVWFLLALIFFLGSRLDFQLAAAFKRQEARLAQAITPATSLEARLRAKQLARVGD